MNSIKRILPVFFALLTYLSPGTSFAQDSLFLIPKPMVQLAGAGHYTFPDESTVFASKPFWMQLNF